MEPTFVPKVKIPTIKMNNDLVMPMLGFGTSRTAPDAAQLGAAVKYAIKVGYRHIDGAWIYFNDPVLGKAAKQAIAESLGMITRDDLYIVCKIWNTMHSKEGVKIGVSDTLTNLGISYGDLFLIHWPMALKDDLTGVDPYPRDKDGKLVFSNVHYLETYRALEECVDQGLTKSIGLSNFNISQCEDVLKNCRIKPVCNQIEVHPYFQNDKLVEFCQNNGMIVVGYSPLGAVDIAESREDVPNILLDGTLIKIGKKYNKTAAQVCLRWSLQKGCVPIVKALEPDQILENGQIFDFELSTEDMNEIKQLNKNIRIFKAPDQKDHPFYPFNEE